MSVDIKVPDIGDFDEVPVIEIHVKKGDEVIFASYAGTEIKLDNEELMIMGEEDVLAVVE